MIKKYSLKEYESNGFKCLYCDEPDQVGQSVYNENFEDTKTIYVIECESCGSEYRDDR